MSRIELYDTTLRDGMQGEGMSLSAQEKLRVAHRLDELGIDLIEAGFPGSNPKELELFELMADETFEHASVAAFGMTRRRDLRAASDDPALRVLADCFAPVCTLVGKTWALHLDKVVKVGRDENLRMICDSVAFLVAQDKRVVYDAEHFFDGFKDDPAYALACLRAAVDGGAETVVLCDTNGGTLPESIATVTASVIAELGCAVGVGIHCHDDAGCGVACSLAAVRQGATHVQGTMNGYGERCGNANLVTIIPNLQLKLGFDCVTPAQLASLTAGRALPRRAAQLHPRPRPALRRAQRVRPQGRDARRRRQRRPGDVRAHRPRGRRQQARAADLRAVRARAQYEARARDAGISLDDEDAARVIDRVKALEHRGYHFEAADGSFELLLRKETGEYEPLFRLESWRAIVEKRADGRVETEATIKIWVRGPDGERYVRTAEGNGPVNALDRALRDALVEIHPRPARDRPRQLQGPDPR